MSNSREHAPYHERRLEQQTLDALLRIEELIKEFLVLLPTIAPPPPAEPEDDRSASMMTSAESTEKRGKAKRK